MLLFPCLPIIIIGIVFGSRGYPMTKDNVVALPFISRDEVEGEIRRIAKDSTSDLVKLDHAIDRMAQREITDRQILNVLRLGERVSDITWNTDKERGWKCTFRRITAGVNVTVATKLVKRDIATCLIVTVF